MIGITGSGTIIKASQTGYGSIEWNLPGELEYQAGQAIPMVLIVTNPSPEAREYHLYLGLYDPETSELIPDTLEVIGVNESDSFTVAGESYIQMEGELSLESTGVILAILLYDVASDNVPGYVTVLLSSPDTGSSNLDSILGGMVAVMAIGMIVPMASGVFKE